MRKSKNLFLAIFLSIVTLAGFVELFSTDAYALTPSWANGRYIWYKVKGRGYSHTTNKKHRGSHRYSSVPYAKSRVDANCVHDGYYQYKCIYKGCKAYKWERTLKGGPHRLRGELKVTKRGTCKTDTLYKIKCIDCNQWIPQKMEGDHVYIEKKNGKRVCKYCGREDDTFSDGN